MGTFSCNAGHCSKGAAVSPSPVAAAICSAHNAPKRLLLLNFASHCRRTRRGSSPGGNKDNTRQTPHTYLGPIWTMFPSSPTKALARCLGSSKRARQ